jgi:hypothetical protein
VFRLRCALRKRNLVHRRFGCRSTLWVRRAARRAVVPSQAPATVSIAESSADTFPAVYAMHPADASTCRASFPGACLAVEPEGAPVRPPDQDGCLHLSCGPGVHGIARRVSVTAGSPGRSGGIVLLSKNADGPLPHPTPLPTLRFACTGDHAGVMDRVSTRPTHDLPPPATKSTKTQKRMASHGHGVSGVNGVFSCRSPRSLPVGDDLKSGRNNSVNSVDSV